MNKHIIVSTTNVTVDSMPKRNRNAKPVFCITNGKIYASAVDAAISEHTHTSEISRCCTGKRALDKGKRYCYVVDMPKHILEISEAISRGFEAYAIVNAKAIREANAKKLEDAIKKLSDQMRVTETKLKKQNDAFDALMREYAETTEAPAMFIA